MIFIKKKIIFIIATIIILGIIVFIGIIINKDDNQGQSPDVNIKFDELYEADSATSNEINEVKVVERINEIYGTDNRKCNFKEKQEENFLVDCYYEDTNELIATYFLDNKGVIIKIDEAPQSFSTSNSSK